MHLRGAFSPTSSHNCNREELHTELPSRMSRTVTVDESNNNQRPPDLFRTLVTDSKLVYLSHAIEQYELAQLQLRQNEDQQRQLRQYMEYNHLRLLELDLTRQRIINSATGAKVGDSDGVEGISDSAMSAGGGAGNNSTNLFKPPDMLGPKTQSLSKARSTVRNALPLQRPFNPTGTAKSTTPHPATGSLLSLPSEPSVIELQSSLVPSAIIVGKGGDEEEDDHPKHDLMMTNHWKNADNPKIAYNYKMVIPYRNWPEKEYNDNDVLCERGNFSYNHVGNRVYREFIKTLQDQYIASKKNDKNLITTKVYEYITKTQGGRFLGHDDDGGIGGWRELSEEEIRRKIGQSLREKNKRYVPAPRKRFVKDFIDSHIGKVGQEEQSSPSQQEQQQQQQSQSPQKQQKTDKTSQPPSPPPGLTSGQTPAPPALTTGLSSLPPALTTGQSSLLHGSTTGKPPSGFTAPQSPPSPSLILMETTAP